MPLVAVATFGLMVFAAVTTAGPNLGWDYSAYVQAAHRAIDGAPLYDATADVAGPRGTYLYPPPFALAVIPFALLPNEIGLWAWVILAIASFVVAVAILPVSGSVRWAVLLLGALDWPLIYSFRLGQVGPLLLLLFAIGWRWLDRPVILGLTMAAGGLAKLQPLFLLVWAGFHARWRAIAVAAATLVLAAGLATVLFGPGVWGDYLMLLGRVSAPVTTPHNFTPGAIAFQAGVREDVATLIQLLSMVVVITVVLISLAKTSPEASYLTTVIASQLLSPVLWDHYAVILLLPVAWLLQRGYWWAAAIPLLTSIPSILVMPPAIYLVVFVAGLLAPLLVETSERRGRRQVTVGLAGSA